MVSFWGIQFYTLQHYCQSWAWMLLLECHIIHQVCRIWWLVTPSNVLHIFRLGFWVHFIKICKPRMTVDVVSCFILITSDSHTEEQTFIKCEQTNLILVVSKLENLLTKVIFQFYSLPLSTLSALSCISIIVLSLLLSKNLIYYFFSSGIIFLFSPVINLCQAVTVVTKCKYHW